MSATINKANLFSSSNCRIRGDNCLRAVSNRCRSVRLRPTKVRCSISWSSSDYYASRFPNHRSEVYPDRLSSRVFSVRSQINGNLRIGSLQKWWEKGLQPNMKEVSSAQDLVDSLWNAGDKLVVVDFFSPGCGGCKALHPKICQIAEKNPDIQFLQVNYEEHKSMCYSLNVHVLPFFRFYRGAEGRVCSFSCTNATIKKFRDALARHTPDRCGLSPPKGLEEKELLALAANRDVSFNYTPKPVVPEKELVPTASSSSAPNRTISLPPPLTTLSLSQGSDKKIVVNSGR